MNRSAEFEIRVLSLIREFTLTVRAIVDLPPRLAIVGSSRLQASLSALLVFAGWEAELTGFPASRSPPGHV